MRFLSRDFKWLFLHQDMDDKSSLALCDKASPECSVVKYVGVITDAALCNTVRLDKKTC